MNATIGRLLILTATVSSVSAPLASAQPACGRTIKADVVALDQAFYNNRLGAFQAGGMIFALRRDVVPVYGTGPLDGGQGDAAPGQAATSDGAADERGRLPGGALPEPARADAVGVQPQHRHPAVSGAGAGQHLFAEPERPRRPGARSRRSPTPLGQPATRLAGVHVMGMELVKAETPPARRPRARRRTARGSAPTTRRTRDPQVRASGLVSPGRSIVYTFIAKAEGAYLLYSTAADVGYPLAFGGQLMQGLFGSVTVQPKTAEWYRSQVTKADLDLCHHREDRRRPSRSIDYDKVYPARAPARRDSPCLKMLDAGKATSSTRT